MLSRWAVCLAVRREAHELLEEGADPDALRDLRVSTTTSLHGHTVACERWGAASLKACADAQKRVREAGLVDGALYLSVLYNVHLDAPPPIYMGGGSGLGSSGLAWTCSSGVDPSIRVKRWPEPEQLELWDLDDVAWTYWAGVRELELDLFREEATSF